VERVEKFGDLKNFATLPPQTAQTMFSNRYFFGFYYFTPPA
jgi:hypothetical protein